MNMHWEENNKTWLILDKALLQEVNQSYLSNKNLVENMFRHHKMSSLGNGFQSKDNHDGKIL